MRFRFEEGRRIHPIVSVFRNLFRHRKRAVSAFLPLNHISVLRGDCRCGQIRDITVFIYRIYQCGIAAAVERIATLHVFRAFEIRPIILQRVIDMKFKHTGPRHGFYAACFHCVEPQIKLRVRFGQAVVFRSRNSVYAFLLLLRGRLHENKFFIGASLCNIKFFAFAQVFIVRENFRGFKQRNTIHRAVVRRNVIAPGIVHSFFNRSFFGKAARAGRGRSFVQPGRNIHYVAAVFKHLRHGEFRKINMVFVYGKRVHEFFARGVGFRNIGFEINARLSFFVRYVFYGFREFFARFFDIFRSVPAIVVLVENNRFIRRQRRISAPFAPAERGCGKGERHTYGNNFRLFFHFCLLLI